MTPFFLGKIIYISFTKVAEKIWPNLPYLYLIIIIILGWLVSSVLKVFTDRYVKNHILNEEETQHISQNIKLHAKNKD